MKGSPLEDWSNLTTDEINVKLDSAWEEATGKGEWVTCAEVRAHSNNTAGRILCATRY